MTRSVRVEFGVLSVELLCPRTDLKNENNDRRVAVVAKAYYTNTQ